RRVLFRSSASSSGVRRTGVSSFFFQAEDGIRAFHVTGVQTCALPISRGTTPGLFDNVEFCAVRLISWVSARPVPDGGRRSAGAAATSDHPRGGAAYRRGPSQ